jgi:hypothetical protein
MQYLHHSAFLNNGLGLVSTAGLKLGDVTMETVEQKVPKGIAVLKCKGSMEGK